MTPDSEESIRCTVSGCGCVCFKPGSVQLRSCDRCEHGWVAHALEKLQPQAQPPSSCGPVEVALPGLVFDLSSLVLYGAQAVPVRLKILLDRLYSILSPEQVGHIILTLGWTLGDYVRGYVLQYPGGRVLDRWLMATPDEELLILKQFLRFGETRPIVELMTLQPLATTNHRSPSSSDPELNPTPKSCRSNIRASIEPIGGALGTMGSLGMFRNTRGDSRLVANIRHFEKSSPPDNNDTSHHFENIPGGHSFLLPFHFPSSAFHFQDFTPPTKDLAPPTKLMLWLQKPSGVKLRERRKERGGLTSPINGNSDVKIKPDPDAPHPVQSPGRSLWQQLHRRIHDNQDPDLQRGVAKAETPSSLCPSFSCSSSSPPKASQKLPPSSSSLHPLPSSLCSLPSPSGGRKGRVCCGVCGKSFYDKGTLKIHYNAVHLKIKHGCTVDGCTMVFSSLRSRNRHSANPNPRLHTATGRDTHTHRDTHPDTHTHRDTHPDTHTHRDTHPDTHTHRDTHPDTHTHRDTHPDTHTHRDTQPDTHTHRDTHPDTHTHRDTHPDTHTHRDTHPDTHTHRDTQPDKHTHRDTHPDTHTHRDIHPDTHTHRDTHPDTHTHRDTHPDTPSNIRLHTDTHTHREAQQHITHITHTHTGACRESRGERAVTDTHRQWDSKVTPQQHTHPMRNRVALPNCHAHPQHGRQHSRQHAACNQPASPALSPRQNPCSPPGKPPSLSFPHSPGVNPSLHDSALRLHPDPQAPPLLSSHMASPLSLSPSLSPLVVPPTDVNKRLLTRHSIQTTPTPTHGSSPFTVETSGSQSVSSNHTGGGAWVSPSSNQQNWWGSGDPVPKKKPRKSSMPLKIERRE